MKVNLNELSEEKKSKMALIELTRLIMREEKTELKLKDAFNRSADLKGLDETERRGKIAQYYTDMNLDGNFVMTGDNMWGLKSWYQDKKRTDDEEDAATTRRRLVRRRTRVEEDDELAEEFAMLDSDIDQVSEDDFEDAEELGIELDGEFAEELDEADQRGI